MSGVALVTGSSTGIGLSTAVRLARAGFTVVATMRDTSKALALHDAAVSAAVEVEVLALDVTDANQVDSRVAEVVARHGAIDVLVNNAGAGRLGSVEQTTLEEARQTFDVNFFGVWSMTRAVVPHMRAAGRGRIISLSSVGGIVGQPFNDAYCAAKFAVEGMSESLAPVLRQFGIFVSLVEPGPVNTNFVDNVGPTVAPLLARTDDPYRPMLERYLEGTRAAFARGQTADDIAEVILEAATAENPHLRYQTSDLARALGKAKFADPDGDSILAVTGARLAAT